MWKIIDNIVGEIYDTTTKEVAIRQANKRVINHNKEFNYSHRGKHYSQNAICLIDEKEQIIKIVRG